MPEYRCRGTLGQDLWHRFSGSHCGPFQALPVVVRLEYDSVDGGMQLGLSGQRSESGPWFCWVLLVGVVGSLLYLGTFGFLAREPLCD